MTPSWPRLPVPRACPGSDAQGCREPPEVRWVSPHGAGDDPGHRASGGGAGLGDSPQRAPWAAVAIIPTHNTHPRRAARTMTPASGGPSPPRTLCEGLGGRQAQLLPALEVVHNAPALDAGCGAQHLGHQLSLHPGDRQAPRLTGASRGREVLPRGESPGDPPPRPLERALGSPE